MELLAFTLDLIGKIMVSYTVIMVHHRVWKQHRIDESVFSEMRKERTIGVVGIAFMVTGYLFHVLTLL